MPNDRGERLVGLIAAVCFTLIGLGIIGWITSLVL